MLSSVCFPGICESVFLLLQSDTAILQTLFSGRADGKGLEMANEKKRTTLMWKTARGSCQGRGARAWEPYRKGDYGFMVALMQLDNIELGGGGGCCFFC